MANMLETLMLKIGPADTAAAWGRVQTSIESVAKSTWNVVQQSDKLMEVADVFGKSADKSFQNATTTMTAMGGRLESITKDFTATNVAMNAAGAAADLLNYRWAELSNTGSRWWELANTKLVGTLLKLYMGYRVLSAVIGITVGSWYKAGQALADNIKIQEGMSESIARMTGNVDSLNHRYAQLASNRVYANAAKDLAPLGKLWQTASQSASLFATNLESLSVKTVTWITSLEPVAGLLSWVNKNLKETNKSAMEMAQSPSLERAFDVKVFKNAGDALKYMRDNMHAWVSETGIAENEIQGSMEKMARSFGDTALAAGVMTTFVAKSHATLGVGSRELLGMFTKLADGVDFTTEELRLFGAELNTGTDEFLRSTKVLDTITKKFIDTAHSIDAIELGEQLRNNLHVRLGLMESDLNTFASLEKRITADMLKDAMDLDKYDATSKEDRARRMKVQREYLDAYYAQLERINAVTRANVQLQSATTGTSIAAKYRSQIEEVQMLVEKAQVYAERGMTETAKGFYAAAQEGYANLAQTIQENGRNFLDMMQSSIAAANRLTRSMDSLVPTSDMKEIGTLIDTQNARVVESFKQRWDFEKQILKASKQGTEEYAQRATNIIQTAQQFRDQMLAGIQQSTAVITEARKGILELYDLEGVGIENNLAKRMSAFDEELRMARKMQAQYKTDAGERVRWIQAEVEAYKKQISEARSLINSQSGDTLTQPASKAAQERVAESWAPKLIRWIESNPGDKLSEQFKAMYERMGSTMQGVVRSALQTSESRRLEDLRGAIKGAYDASGGTMSGFVEQIKKALPRQTDQQIALRNSQEILDQFGVKLLTGQKPKEDPYKGLNEAITKFEEAQKLAQKNLENAQKAVEDFDKREAAFLGKVTTAIGQVTDAGTKFQDLTKLLGLTFDEITRQFGIKINDDFGGEVAEFGDDVTSLKSYLDKFQHPPTPTAGTTQESPKGPPPSSSLGPDRVTKIADAIAVSLSDMDSKIKTVMGSTRSTTEKEQRVNEILREYKTLFDDANKSAAKFSKTLGVADDAGFRTALVEAMKQTAASALNRRERFIGQQWNPNTEEGQQAKNFRFAQGNTFVERWFNPTEITRDIQDAVKKGFSALEIVPIAKERGAKFGPGAENAVMELAFNYASILARGAQKQANQPIPTVPAVERVPAPPTKPVEPPKPTEHTKREREVPRPPETPIMDRIREWERSERKRTINGQEVTPAPVSTGNVVKKDDTSVSSVAEVIRLIERLASTSDSIFKFIQNAASTLSTPVQHTTVINNTQSENALPRLLGAARARQNGINGGRSIPR